MRRRIWITWEWQRRSIELSEKLSCRLFIVTHRGPTRYLFSMLDTILILRRSKPYFLFVQNPSMLLAAIACFYALFNSFVVVVDRHSNFQLHGKSEIPLYNLAFKWLHLFTVRVAHLTIVTNPYLAQWVRRDGGTPFVLPDKLPKLNPLTLKATDEVKTVFLISSFGKDEPLLEAIEAARLLASHRIRMLCSGNYTKLPKSVLRSCPKNFLFTGFLPESAFVETLFSSDAIMALTTIDFCMLCGCYEAISAEKPLITSAKRVLQDYFIGSVFVDNTPLGIANGIIECINNKEHYVQNSKHLKQKLVAEWEKEFSYLERRLGGF